MLGYKLIKIRPSFRGFDYESDAVLLLDLNVPYLLGTVFFNDIGSRELVPVRAEYEDPETGVIKAVTLEEKPRGEWLYLGDNAGPKHKWSCNRCGRAVEEQENFCPNCGIKMVKEM